MTDSESEKMQYSFLLGEPLVRGAVFEIRLYEVGLTISGIIREKKKDSVFLVQ
jgi:hypothetical protein